MVTYDPSDRSGVSCGSRIRKFANETVPSESWLRNADATTLAASSRTGNAHAWLILASRYAGYVESLVWKFTSPRNDEALDAASAAAWSTFYTIASNYQGGNAAFTTYLFPYIHGSIVDANRRWDGLQDAVSRAKRKIAQAWRELPQELGCTPSLTEIRSRAISLLLSGPKGRYSKATAEAAIDAATSASSKEAGAETEEEDSDERNSSRAELDDTQPFADPLAQLIRQETNKKRVLDGQRWARHMFSQIRRWLGPGHAEKYLLLFLLHDRAFDAERIELEAELGATLPPREWEAIVALLEPGAQFPLWPRLWAHYALWDIFPSDWPSVQSIVRMGRKPPTAEGLRAQYKRATDRIMDCRRLNDTVRILAEAADELKATDVSVETCDRLGSYQSRDWPLDEGASSRAINQAALMAGRHLFILMTELGARGSTVRVLKRLATVFCHHFTLASGEAPGPNAVRLNKHSRNLKSDGDGSR